MPSSNPAVTVIVPTFRRPHLLEVCLDSLRAQTFRDFTVLICDNANDPATADIVANLQDSRLVYVPRPKDLGILGNVVEGYRAARSEYVMELDDDDFLAPRCLERLVTPMEGHPEIALSFSDLEVVDSEGLTVSPQIRRTKIQDSRVLHEGLYEDFTQLAARGYIFTVAALLRRSAVDWSAIPADATTAYDRYLAIAAARTGAAAYYIDERLAFYRVHPGADSSRQYVAQWQGAIFVLQNALAGSTERERAILQTEIANLRFEMVRFRTRERDWGAAARATAVGLSSPQGARHALRLAQGALRRARSRS